MLVSARAGARDRPGLALVPEPRPTQRAGRRRSARTSDSPDAIARSRLADRTAALAERRLVRSSSTLSYSLQGYVGYIFVSWFYLYLVQERHFGLLEGAWMSSLPWVLSIVSIPLGGFVADRLAAGRLGPTWGPRAVAMTGHGRIGHPDLDRRAHRRARSTAAVTLALATALVLCVEGPFWSTVTRMQGRQSGTAGGVMNTGCNIGGLISPALTPVLAASIGWEARAPRRGRAGRPAALLWLGIRGDARQPGV